MRNRRTDRPSGDVPFRLWAPARFRAAVSMAAAGALGLVPAVAVLPGVAHAEAVPTVSVGAAPDVAEGEPMRFPLTLSEPADADVTVTVSTTGGDASVNADYTALTELEVTFPQGDVTATVEVPTIADGNDENLPESVVLEIVDAGAAMPGTVTGTGDIVDAVFSVTPVGDIDEGDADRTQYFDITLNVGFQSSITVDYSIATGTGTAVSGEDFTGVALDPLTFAPGEKSKRVEMTIHGDEVYRGDNRTFIVNLMNLVGGTARGMETRTFTILDDETVPQIASISDVTVTEGTSGTAVASFTVTLTNPTQESVTLDVSATGGTATETPGTVGGFDFDAPTAVTFAPGAATTTFDVNVIGDDVFETTETTPIVVTPPDGSTTVTGTARQATLTIEDDDAKPAFAFDPFSTTEGEAGAPIGFAVTGEAQAPYTWTAEVGGVIDDQTVHAADADFSRSGLTLSGTLEPGDDRIDLGTLSAVEDTADEFDEKIKVALDAGELGAGEGIAVIQDAPDQLPPPLNGAPVGEITLHESASLDIPITLGFDPNDGNMAESTEKIVTLDWTATPGTATEGTDYQGASGQLIYEAGSTSENIPLRILSDNVAEPDETFTITLDNPENAEMPGGGQFTVIIKDPPSTVSLDAPQTVAEGKPLRFPITLSQARAVPITVTVTTTGGTATAGTDYTALDGHQVTFAPGETSKFVEVETLPDGGFEADAESVTLEITDPGAAVAGTGTASGDIVDPLITVTQNGDVTEGDSGTRNQMFMVFLNPALTTEVSVDVEVVAGTAVAGEDFDPVALQTLTFAPGETWKQIDVPIHGDTIFEGEDQNFKILLSNANGASVENSEYTFNLIDYDEARTITSVSSTPQTEGDGSGEVVFTVQLSSPAGSDPIILDVTGVDDTAVRAGAGPGGADYDFPSEVTVQPGQSQATFVVTVNGDQVFEKDERAQIVVTPRPGDLNVTGPAQQSTLTVYNDDAVPAVTFDGFDQQESAGGVGVWFTVSGVAQDPMPWTATVHGASDHGNTDPAEATDFAAGGLILSGQVMSGDTRVDLGTVDFLTDSADEYDETIEASVVVDDRPAVTGYGTIRDWHTQLPPRLRTPEQISVAEGADAVVPVTLDFAAVPGNTATTTEKVITADYAVTAGTAQEGEDYPQTSGTVMIEPPLQSSTISVPTLLSAAAEPDETFDVTLFNPRDAEVNGPPVRVTISEDKPAVSIGSPGVTPEGRPLRFPLTLSHPSSSPVTVRFATTGGTATPGADYVPAAGTEVTFQPGQVTADAVVPTNTDTELESDSETVTVEITDPGTATLGAPSAYGKIVDPAIRIDSVAFSDANPQNVVVGMQLAIPLDAEVRADYELLLGNTVISSGVMTYAPGETLDQITAAVPAGVAVTDLTVKLSNLVTPSGLRVWGEGEHRAQIGSPGSPGSQAAVVGLVRNGWNVESDAATTMTFTVVLDRPVTERTVLNVRGDDGTAVQIDNGLGGRDYTVPSTVAVEAGESSGIFEVTINGDDVYEGAEQAEIVVSAPSGDPRVTGQAQSQLSITDDDDLPTVTFSGFDHTEGDQGAVVGFDVTGVAQEPFEWTAWVQSAYDAPNAGYAQDDDYDASHLALSGTLQPGSPRIELGVMGLPVGNADEFDEAFQVTVHNSWLGGTSGFGTIHDLPSQMPPRIVPVGDVTVEEGTTATALFDVDFDAVPGNTATTTEKPLGITYTAVGGSATAGTDFTAVSQPVMYEGGETQLYAEVEVLGDTVAEGDETFTIDMSNPENVEYVGPGPTVTIKETNPTVSIGSPGTTPEGRPLTFPLTLSHPSGTPVTVRFATTGGTAIPGADYTPIPPTEFTFQPGQTTGAVHVATHPDNAFEQDSETVVVDITDPGTATLGTASAYGKIVDTALRVGALEIGEDSAGFRTAFVDVVLTVPLDTELRADYGLLTGPGTAGPFTEATSGVLTFAPGETSKRIAVPAPVPATAFKLRVSNLVMASGLPVWGEGEHVFTTSGDADPGTRTIVAVSSAPQAEGDGPGQAVVTVQLSSPAPEPITLDVSSTDDSAVRQGSGPGSADFSVPSEVTVPAGQTQASFPVTINGDDVFEPNEQAWITVTPRANDPKVTGPAQQTPLIINNDDDAPTVTFDGFDQSEGAGGVGVWFTVTGDAQDPMPWTATVQGDSDGNSDPAEATDFGRGGLALSGTLAPGADRIDLGTVDFPMDSADEYDETIAASVVVDGRPAVAGHGTIRDWHTQLPPRIVLPDGTFTVEGDAATLPVGLDFASVPGNTATSTEKTITFDYLPLAGSAAVGDDFPAAGGTVTIDPPSNATVIQIPTRADDVPESDETFTVSLSNLRNAERIGPQPTVTIRESRPTVSVGSPPETVAGRPLHFPVTLSQPSAAPVTLRYSTMTTMGSAVPGADYVPATDASVTIPAGATTAVISVPTIVGTPIVGQGRTVYLQLTHLGDTVLDNVIGRAEIVGAGIMVGESEPVMEGGSGVQTRAVEVRLSGPMDATVSVDYTLLADTAVEGVDYDPVSGHLTFAPGETLKTIQVPIRGDEVPENHHKVFKVRLTNLTHAGGLQLWGGGEHPITIQEDDNTAEPLSITSVTADPRPEGNGVSTAPMTVTLSGPAPYPITLNVGPGAGSAAPDGDGIGGSDYSVPQTVTVATGSATATIDVTVKGDTVFERDEVAEVKVAPRADEAGVVPSEVVGTLTLTNDDAAPKVTFDGFEQSEGTGGIGAWFTVTGDAQDPLPWTAVVEGGSDGGSDPAEAGDFTRDKLTLSGTLAPGGDQIDVGDLDFTMDSADEHDETIKVAVDVEGLGNTTGYGKIWDWNTQLPPKVVAAGPITVDETGTATVPVKLDFTAVPGNTATSTEKLVTVDYNTTGGTATAGADFTSTSGTLVFTPPSTVQNVEVPTLADGVVENDETLTVDLTNPANAEVGGTPATVTIRGAAAPSYQVQPNVTVTEGKDAAAQVTVTLASVAAGPVDFTVSAVDDSARRGQSGPGGDDYGSPASIVTIPQGQTSATVTVPIVDDHVFEEKESAKITVAPAAGETEVSGPAQDSLLTVLDDDPAPTITLTPAIGTEGGLVDVIAVPSGVAEDPIGYLLTFNNRAPVNDPAEREDYVDSGETAVLPGGSTDPILLRSIPLAADTIDELTESITVTATSQAVPGAPAVSAVYGIVDDPYDLPPSAVALPANVREDLGFAEVPVVLEFTGGNGATSTDQPVTVYYEVLPGTATGVDFSAPPVTQLFFPPGVTYGVIRVPITNDRRTETDETFQVRLVAVDPFGGSIARANSDVVIVDDDRNLPRPSFTVSGDVTAGEGGTATFTVTLSEPAQGDVDLVVETQPGSATAAGNEEGGKDYGPPPAALRIPEGGVSGSVTVPINQDTVYEGDETARIAVSLAAGEMDAAGQTQVGQLRITDDDKAPTIALEPTAATVDEGATIELSGIVTGTAQRDFELGTAAAAGIAADGEDAGPDDFEVDNAGVMVPGGTPSGAKFRLGTISFLDDSVDENIETATVTMAGVTRTFRITDDPDDTPPAVSIADVSVGESAGTAKLTVSLEFTGGATSTSRTVKVPWSTADGTADAGKDYTKSSGTVTFEPDVDRAAVAVPILPDTKDEADQSFTVKLGTPSPADVKVTAAEAEVVILDDDKAKAPTLAVPDSNTGAGRITISGTAAPNAKVELLTASGVSGGTLKVVSTTEADDDGAYSFRPNFAHGYRVQVRVGGQTSPVRTIQVRQDPGLTAVSNAKGAATLTVTGDPDEPGQKVTIQRQVKGGWDEVDEGKLAANGKFTTTVRSLKAGNNVFRAVISATPSLGILAGTSPARSVKVK
jgi:hypothetical protein